MCGRFTLFEADKILSKEFGVSGFPPLSPRYNIAPSQPRGGRPRGGRGHRSRACPPALGAHPILVERPCDRQPSHQRPCGNEPGKSRPSATRSGDIAA